MPQEKPATLYRERYSRHLLAKEEKTNTFQMRKKLKLGYRLQKWECSHSSPPQNELPDLEENIVRSFKTNYISKEKEHTKTGDRKAVTSIPSKKQGWSLTLCDLDLWVCKTLATKIFQRRAFPQIHDDFFTQRHYTSKASFTTSEFIRG